MSLYYTDILSDGRRVVVEAQYDPADYTPGQESDERAYILHVWATVWEAGQTKEEDIRLSLAASLPSEYQRLRRECLTRVLHEREVLAGEHAELRQMARLEAK